MPVNWEVLKTVFFVTDEEGDEWFNMVYFPSLPEHAEMINAVIIGYAAAFTGILTDTSEQCISLCHFSLPLSELSLSVIA